MKSYLSKSVVVLSASMLFCTTGFASVVFDSTAATNSLNRSYTPGNGIEFGNQIFLGGSDRRITDFQFDYFLDPNATGNEKAELFFYLNNGAGGTTPGTLLYRSGQFSLGAGFQSAFAAGLSVTVPNSFTWTVLFSGINFGEQVGLMLNNPATVGTALDDFWVKNPDGSWATFNIDAGKTPALFAARVTAVPEPSTYALAISMVVAWIGYRGYKRRSA